MTEQGLLLNTERGVPVVIPFPDKDPFGPGFFTYYDAFNPAARAFHWEVVKRNYVDRGIRNFWLDACEPEMRPPTPNTSALRAATGQRCSAPTRCCMKKPTERASPPRATPRARSSPVPPGRGRSGLASSSGRAMSGPTGTGSAPRSRPASIRHGGHGLVDHRYRRLLRRPRRVRDFRDLLVRWFEFGVFSPICRLHGFRVPDDVPPPAPGEPVTYGQETFNIFTNTGGANEVWSFGPAVEAVLTRLLSLRERLRPYLTAAFDHYARTGDPVMAPLFCHFPDQPDLHDRGDAYMLGPDLLVAPVLAPRATSRSVALPRGETWVDAWTGTAHDGGTRPRSRPPGPHPRLHPRRPRERPSPDLCVRHLTRRPGLPITWPCWTVQGTGRAASGATSSRCGSPPRDPRTPWHAKALAAVVAAYALSPIDLIPMSSRCWAFSTTSCCCRLASCLSSG